MFLQFFPNFGGRTGEGNFVIFPHFSRISTPEAARGPLKGKTARKACDITDSVGGFR